MKNIQNLLRPNIRKLTPYSSARDEFKGEASIFLDANENSLGSITGDTYNRYPDPLQWQLKTKLAAYKALQPEQIFLGNGSDEAIDLLFRAFCRPQVDNIIILPPTYGMYSVSANINDVEIRTCPLTTDFQPNVSAIMQLVDAQTKLIFICSPNNPTGNLIHESSVKELLERFAGIVVVDEAYIDFANSPSWIEQLTNHPNLVVLQTFSKAWGLANIRLGMAFASRMIIDIFNKIKPPYNINGLTQAKGLEALDNINMLEESIRTLLEERKKLGKALSQMDVVKHIYPSAANFILVRVQNARELYQMLLNEGIVVRNRSNVLLCEECLRITVGTPMENARLLEILHKIAV